MIEVLTGLAVLLAVALIVLQVMGFRSTQDSLERVERSVRDELRGSRVEQSAEQARFREELGIVVARLQESNDRKLEQMRQDSAQKLEQMRATVDEKLQGVLEKRLGESFRAVSERLEQVHKGLGEMQSLAAGVGDLRRVLTNVKTRGTWGEVVLGRLLEDALTPQQYEANVATSGTSERVEYAVRLPGRSGEPSEVVWLPIDSKFPVESYERLHKAQDEGDLAAAEREGKMLEVAVLRFGKSVSEKYICPPRTTDFAILFLPTEGLFAEVIRRAALVDDLQRQHRVMVAGPTTLLALLSSLQMGFRTLAIEQRSSEVWQLLAAVKTEWSRYGESLSAVHKKIEAVAKSLGQAEVRARAVGRKLRSVESLSEPESHAVLNLEEQDDEDPEG